MDKAKQVAQQYRAVAHMARCIAQVHSEIGATVEQMGPDAPLDIMGQRSARLMELFGDVMNDMDIVESDDDWISPILRRAQETWPEAARPQSLHGLGAACPRHAALERAGE